MRDFLNGDGTLLTVGITSIGPVRGILSKVVGSVITSFQVP